MGVAVEGGFGWWWCFGVGLGFVPCWDVFWLVLCVGFAAIVEAVYPGFGLCGLLLVVVVLPNERV